MFHQSIATRAELFVLAMVGHFCETFIYIIYIYSNINFNASALSILDMGIVLAVLKREILIVSYCLHYDGFVLTVFLQDVVKAVLEQRVIEL